MRRPGPSDTPPKFARPTAQRTTKGVHAFDTQVRSLEQACDLIAHYQRIEKAKKTKEKNKKPITLAQELGLARGHSMMKKISLPGGKTWRNPRVEKMVRLQEERRAKNPPHPFKDHPDKPAKVREMLESGFWGMGVPAYRRLAKLFGVSIGEIVYWAEGNA